eukprot:763914-Hanusia_phi.AAC.1
MARNVPGEDEAAVEVEIVWHHGRSEDPDTEEETVGVAHEGELGKEAAFEDPRHVGLTEVDLHDETDCDSGHEREDDPFQDPHLVPTQRQHQQDVSSCDENPDCDGDGKEKFERKS